jgi:hypothetical protein
MTQRWSRRQIRSRRRFINRLSSLVTFYGSAVVPPQGSPAYRRRQTWVWAQFWAKNGAHPRTIWTATRIGPWIRSDSLRRRRQPSTCRLRCPLADNTTEPTPGMRPAASDVVAPSLVESGPRPPVQLLAGGELTPPASSFLAAASSRFHGLVDSADNEHYVNYSASYRS